MLLVWIKLASIGGRLYCSGFFWGGGDVFSSSEPGRLLLLRFFLVFSSSSPSGGVAFTACNYRRYQSDISRHTSADPPTTTTPPKPPGGLIAELLRLTSEGDRRLRTEPRPQPHAQDATFDHVPSR